MATAMQWAEFSVEESEHYDGSNDHVWPRRAAARQRQIGIGKARPEYKRYLQRTPVDCRTIEHPRTPDYNARISKRQFDRELGEWRRKLHEQDGLFARVSPEPRPARLNAHEGAGQFEVGTTLVPAPKASRARRAAARRNRGASGPDAMPPTHDTNEEPPETSQPLKQFEFPNIDEIPDLPCLPDVVQLKLADRLSGPEHSVLEDPGQCPWWLQDGDSWQRPSDDYVSQFGQPWVPIVNQSFVTPPRLYQDPGEWTPINPNLPQLPTLGHSYGWPQEVPYMSPMKAGDSFPACPTSAPGLELTDEDGDRMPEDPRTPRRSRAWSPSVLRTANSQQASLPATPQMRGWVQETPSPSRNWGLSNETAPPLVPTIANIPWQPLHAN